MVTEKDLIDFIYKDCSTKNFDDACAIKLSKLKKEPQIKLLVKVIHILYYEGMLDFGPYLSQYKSQIIELIYKALKDKFESLNLMIYLKNIKKYGALIKFLEETKGFEDFILCDFFKILSNRQNIKDIINKYFNKEINKELPKNFTINNADEFLEYIDKSLCLKDGKYNYLMLFEYIKGQQVKNNIKNNMKNKRKKKNKKLIYPKVKKAKCLKPYKAYQKKSKQKKGRKQIITWKI